MSIRSLLHLRSRPFDAVIVLWWPDSSTSTRKARAVLPAAVPFGDAVFNVGRVALLVAAFAAGDRDAMAVAVQDRLHQDARLALSPGSGEALDAILADTTTVIFPSPAGERFTQAPDGGRPGGS